MPVVTTAVKNHPSKRASLDWTALTQRSTSSCTSVRIEGGTTRGLAEKRHQPARPSRRTDLGGVRPSADSRKPGIHLDVGGAGGDSPEHRSNVPYGPARGG